MSTEGDLPSPLTHYLLIGWHQGACPNPLFDSKFYLRSCSEARLSKVNPLTHYVTLGASQHYKPHPLFDPTFYSQRYPEVHASGLEPLLHYLTYGATKHLQPHPLFDPHHYLSCLKKFKISLESSVSPIQHYLDQGAQNYLSPHPSFDVEYYCQSIGGLRALQGLDPLTHYLTLGCYQGHRPNVDFDAAFYIRNCGDKSVTISQALIQDTQRLGRLQSYTSMIEAAKRWQKEASLAKYTEESTPFQLPLYHDMDGLLRELQAAHSLYGCPKDGMPAVYLASKLIELIRASKGASILKSQRPLVSVIMATYNRADLLPQAIQSILNQTYDHWELWIVDDRSTDGTADLLKRYQAQDSRIKVLQGNQRGIAHTRNVALAKAQGEFISYLDSDNVWEPYFLEVSLSRLLATQSKLSYCAALCYDGANYKFQYRPFSRYQLVFKSNFIDLNILVHHRELVELHGGFTESLLRLVDWELIIRYTKDHQPTSIPLIGAWYDHRDRQDRITLTESTAWKFKVRNLHWIDWNAQLLKTREKGLVSVILYAEHAPDLTKLCLQKLLNTDPGTPFEILVVTKGTHHGHTRKLKKQFTHFPQIHWITPTSDQQGSLSRNLAAVASRGEFLVFLDTSIGVTHHWLSDLIPHLSVESIAAVQPKIVTTSNQIAHAGSVFMKDSCLVGPWKEGSDALDIHTRSSRSMPALSGLCLGVRALDFLSVQGFDPCFWMTHADTDLCLRLLQLPARQAHWYVAECIVTALHKPNRPPQPIEKMDSKLYQLRWGHLAARSPFDQGHPSLECSDSESLNFAIKLACPNASDRHHCPDYELARALGIELNSRGHRYRIDYSDQWEDALPHDINLVIGEAHLFTPDPKIRRNFLWLTSPPQTSPLPHLNLFDHVFVASERLVHELKQASVMQVSCLLKATRVGDYPPESIPPFRQDKVLHVGSEDILAHLIHRDFQVTSLGHSLAPSHGRQKTSYAGVGAVVIDTTEDLRSHGFLSQHFFDMLAFGTPIVCEPFDGVPVDLQAGVFFYDSPTAVAHAVKQALALSFEQRQALARRVHEYHRVEQRSKLLTQTVLSYLQSQHADT